MGLITKTVKVKWNKSNKRHYEDLGYEFTKYDDEFYVKVDDAIGSIMIDCVCDNCNRPFSRVRHDYIKSLEKYNATYCPECATSISMGLDGFKSFYTWCNENNKTEFLERWDYSLNSLRPEDINHGSKKKFWFKCDKHPEHKSELKTIKSLTYGNIRIMKCSQCYSLAQWFIDNQLDINLYWDYEKNNGVDPWKTSYGSKVKYWFKCNKDKNHGSYLMKPNCFTGDAQRCPYCSGVKVCKSNSIGAYIENKYGQDFLNRIWSDKNTKTPYEYTSGSTSKVWFKCSDGKHADYNRTIINARNYEFRCPNCMQEKKESMIEDKTRLYLEELGYNVLHEHDCTLRPINPKTKSPMPYDNEIIWLNGKHLIREVHGEQHYIEHTGYFKGKLKQRQLYDRYKKAYAEHYGYEYLEIPYTAFRGKTKNLYKQMIDNKIEEILHNTKAS